MKKRITVLLMITASVASAQWSNTTNQFDDTLHMPVCTEAGVQDASIVVQSFPDSGYFVIWQDRRDGFYSNTKIYVQKYDKTGNRQWAPNGVPVATGPNNQHYTYSSNQDYRNRSIAATDSAGGLFITYADDSVTNYVWQRACVQHLKSNGSLVFPGIGYVVATSTAANLNIAPQLVPDGDKGFYIGYKNNLGNDNIFVYGFKDEGGIMKNYGGGHVNQNATQRTRLANCGVQSYLDYPGVTVHDFNIWPDQQGGCNVIINMNGNAGDQHGMLCFNRVWRAKKDSKVKTFLRNTSGTACQVTTDYKKGSAYVLYTLRKDAIITTCGTLDGSKVYVVTSERLLSNGYQLIDGSYISYPGGGYDYNFPKGVTIATPGNINVDVIAVTKRTYANNAVSNFVVMGYAYPAEHFDSVPYQRASYGNPDIGNNPKTPLQQNKLNFFLDTLLAAGNYFLNFSLAGGGKEVYASGLMSTSGSRIVRLQHLSVERVSPNSFALSFKTDTKNGVPIGNEVSTGFSGSNISYDLPIVIVANNGNAFFYIREYYRSARVSPIFNGAELGWGAMGRPIGTGAYNGSFYNLEQPFSAITPTGATGLIAWKDNKNIPGGTSDNIFMRRLDRLDEKFLYAPPLQPVKSVYNPYGATTANPTVLLGSSKRLTAIEAYTDGYYSGNAGTSTVAQIVDEYNFGSVAVNVFQNKGTIRKHNNRPYLDRNYTMKPSIKPVGANILLQLFFTKEEFNALKANDNVLKNPGDLIVIAQQNNTSVTPTIYTSTLGDVVLSPTAWDSVAGGYYLEIKTGILGNFFIQSTNIAALCPNGSTSIVSSISGTSYQWQLNTGTGYINLTNNSYYTGANTTTLQINNVPSAWAGYQYICNVDGKNSGVTTLQITNTWTGTSDNHWENSANWTCGSIPDANTDVVLTKGTVVVNANTICRSLTVYPGVNFTVKPGVIFSVTK